MKTELKKREIEKCKDLLKDPTLGYNQRFNIKSYLIALEIEDTK